MRKCIPPEPNFQNPGKLQKNFLCLPILYSLKQNSKSSAFMNIINGPCKVTRSHSAIKSVLKKITFQKWVSLVIINPQLPTEAPSYPSTMLTASHKMLATRYLIRKINLALNLEAIDCNLHYYSNLNHIYFSLMLRTFLTDHWQNHVFWKCETITSFTDTLSLKGVNESIDI